MVSETILLIWCLTKRVVSINADLIQTTLLDLYSLHAVFPFALFCPTREPVAEQKDRNEKQACGRDKTCPARI